MDYVKERSMFERVKDAYGTAHEILSSHCMINALAMRAAHVMGYNGFKRWHRCRAREFVSLVLALENELYDRFNIVPKFDWEKVEYLPESLKEHLRHWESSAFDGIKSLGEASRLLFDETGMRSCVIEKALKVLSKDHEHIARLRERFEESDWLTFDVHAIDDKLHRKFKKKEERDGCR